MASHILDTETVTDQNNGGRHKRLVAWVEEIAQLTKPDRVHWCDGTDDEYQAMVRFGELDETGMRRIRLTHTTLGAIDLADWSGVILGGGPYNVSDPEESKSPTQRRVESELLSLTERIVNSDFPFLGCCYGVGILGSVVGATVDRSYPEPVAAVTVTLSPW